MLDEQYVNEAVDKWVDTCNKAADATADMVILTVEMLQSVNQEQLVKAAKGQLNAIELDEAVDWLAKRLPTTDNALHDVFIFTGSWCAFAANAFGQNGDKNFAKEEAIFVKKIFSELSERRNLEKAEWQAICEDALEASQDMIELSSEFVQNEDILVKAVKGQLSNDQVEQVVDVITSNLQVSDNEYLDSLILEGAWRLFYLGRFDEENTKEFQQVIDFLNKLRMSYETNRLKAIDKVTSKN